MRFLVDLFRYIIYAICALALIGATLLVLIANDHSNPVSAYLAGGMAGRDRRARVFGPEPGRHRHPGLAP